jgi:hypothetical protein
VEHGTANQGRQTMEAQKGYHCLSCSLFTARKEKEDSFDLYKEYAQWIMRTEHLFISWYAVLDVGLKLDAEDYEDKEKYIQSSYCMRTYPYFLCQVYEKFSY